MWENRTTLERGKATVARPRARPVVAEKSGTDHEYVNTSIFSPVHLSETSDTRVVEADPQ